MKNEIKVFIGLLMTILIFLISIILSKIVQIPIKIIPNSFLTTLSELILSGLLISYMQSKGLMTFRLKLVQIKIVLRAILTAIIAFVIINILTVIVFKIFHISLQEKMNPFLKFSPLQYFLFIFIFASIAEEILFRGFLLNMLESYSAFGLKIFKIKISIPVIISGLLFGLAHFILLATGAGLPFVLKIVFLTTSIGLLAGYFQEKYDKNTLVPIVVHMTVNGLGLIGLILTLAMTK
jgi:membrane protease YdiL (CAAX protease family)